VVFAERSALILNRPLYDVHHSLYLLCVRTLALANGGVEEGISEVSTELEMRFMA
jgi:hypothetical protein